MAKAYKENLYYQNTNLAQIEKDRTTKHSRNLHKIKRLILPKLILAYLAREGNTTIQVFAYTLLLV